jgi:hypothetical protein
MSAMSALDLEQQERGPQEMIDTLAKNNRWWQAFGNREGRWAVCRELLESLRIIESAVGDDESAKVIIEMCRSLIGIQQTIANKIPLEASHD